MFKRAFSVARYETKYMLRHIEVNGCRMPAAVRVRREIKPCGVPSRDKYITITEDMPHMRQGPLFMVRANNAVVLYPAEDTAVRYLERLSIDDLPSTVAGVTTMVLLCGAPVSVFTDFSPTFMWIGAVITAAPFLWCYGVPVWVLTRGMTPAARKILIKAVFW